MQHKTAYWKFRHWRQRIVMALLSIAEGAVCLMAMGMYFPSLTQAWAFSCLKRNMKKRKEGPIPDAILPK